MHGILRRCLRVPCTSLMHSISDLTGKLVSRDLRAFAVRFATTVRILRESPTTNRGELDKSTVNVNPLRLASFRYRTIASSMARWRSKTSLKCVSLPLSKRVRSCVLIYIWSTVPRPVELAIRTSKSLIVNNKLCNYHETL